MMKRVLFLAAVLVAAISCSDAEIDDFDVETPDASSATELTIAVSMSDELSRVAVNDDWSVEWKEDDSIWVWGNDPTIGTGDSGLFTMSAFDEDESTFTGSIGDGYVNYRILYACGEDSYTGGNKLYSINLTAQEAGATSSYMITEDVCDYSDLSGSPSLKHIGAAVEVIFYFDAAYADYTIENVAVTGLNSGAEINLESAISDDDFYYSLSSDAITINTASMEIDSDGMAKVRFNIMPTTIVAGSSVIVTATIKSEDTEKEFVQVINVPSDVEFPRSTYNTIYCSSMVIENDYWTSYASDSFEGDGEGTIDDPYKITTAAQLAKIAEDVNGATDTYEGEYFELQNDIDLSAHEWVAIGIDNSANRFKGTFDGGGHEISGLYINESTSENQGLFGRISGATIKSVGVSGSVSGGKYVGGVVGYASSSSSVTNCYNTGSVSGSSNVGSVAGCIEDDPLTMCYYLDGSCDDGVGKNQFGTTADIAKKTQDEMTAAGFVETLNTNANSYNSGNTTAVQACGWTAITSSYPTLSFGSTPNSDGTATAQ